MNMRYLHLYFFVTLACFFLLPRGYAAKSTIKERGSNSLPDFSVHPLPVRPGQWSNSKSWSVQEALVLGEASTLPVPAFKMKLPFWTLSRLQYFVGNDVLTQQLNNAISNWSMGRFQSAYDVFYGLDKTLNSMPEFAPAALVARTLRAFFYQQLSVLGEVELRKLNLTTQTQGKESEDSIGVFFAKKSFSDFIVAYRHFPLDLFSNESTQTIDIGLYQDIIKNPLIYDDKVGLFSFFKSSSANNNTVYGQNADPLQWLESVFIPCMWNTALALHLQGNTPASEEVAEKISQSFLFLRGLNTSYKEPPRSSSAETQKVQQDFLFIPQVRQDFLSGLYLKYIQVFLEARQYAKVFAYINKIQSSKLSEDLLFLLYQTQSYYQFKINNFEAVQKNYEKILPNFIKLPPFSLLIFGESAFWYGDLKKAKDTFLRFLEVTGDREYGPWVRLRLAEIEHIQKNMNVAIEGYDQIVHLFPNHEASQNAKIRLFCQTISDLGPNGLLKESAHLSEVLKLARPIQKEQGRHCLLQAKLKLQQTDLIAGELKSKILAIYSQLEDIDKVSKDSKYAEVFTDKKQNLNLLRFTLLAAESRCSDLVQYYSKFSTQIQAIQSGTKAEQDFFVNWGDAEKKQLWRCSALLKAKSIWKQQRMLKIYEKYRAFENIVYKFSFSNKESDALLLFKELFKNNSLLIEKNDISKIENFGNAIINDENFWIYFANVNLLNFDLYAKKVEKEKFLKTVVNYILYDNPKKIDLFFKNSTLCSWLLGYSQNLTIKDLDTIAKNYEFHDLSLLKKSSSNQTCESEFGESFVLFSQTRPSSVRDQKILIPLLNKSGFKDADSLWFSYAKRLSLKKGKYHSEVLKIITEIKNQSEDASLKKAATLWIEEFAAR